MSFDFTRRNFLATGAAAATLPIIGTQASAQAAWPNKPIKIIAGYPAGGQTDLFARTYGDVISKKIGQPIIVENKAGAGGTVAALEVKRAAPDGYTWQFTISTTMIMNRVLMKDVPYDADKDFILISIMPAGSLPMVASAEERRKEPQGVRRLLQEERQGERRHVRGRLVRAYGGGRTEQAVRTEDRAGALSRRGADVGRPCRPDARRCDRQLRRARRRCCRVAAARRSPCRAGAIRCCRMLRPSRSRERPRSASS